MNTMTDETPESSEKNQPGHSQDTENAIQRLIKSGCSQATVCKSDFDNACNKLLHLDFDTEKGRLNVIDNLCKLNGNFVAKIIDKGLCRLNMVYTNKKSFEYEAIQLVELCLSLYDKQCEAHNCTLPSPAIATECTFDLCNEMLKSRLNGAEKSCEIHLSKYVRQLVDLCETFLRNLLVFVGYSKQKLPRDSFNILFEVLKPKIAGESFEELLRQTNKIAKEDAKLNCLIIKSLYGQTPAILLEAWMKLLQFSFVTNWCAIYIAKMDFLLNENEYTESLQWSNKHMYAESLILEVHLELKCRIEKDTNYQLPSDNKRLQIFFDHPEVMIVHRRACFDLLNSNIPNNYIEELFDILGIQLSKVNCLPRLTTEKRNEYIDTIKKVLQGQLEREKSLKMLGGFQQESQFSESFEVRQNLTFILETFINFLRGVSTQEQVLVLKVLRFWKNTFTDENYKDLFYICSFLFGDIELKKNGNYNRWHVELLAEFLDKIENHEILQHYLQNHNKTTEDDINDVIIRSFYSINLTVNATNALRLLKLDGAEDQILWNLIQQCAEHVKNRDKEFFKETLETLLLSVEQTLQTADSRYKYAQIVLKYISIIANSSPNAKVCQTLLACIAGAIAVGTFEDTENHLVLNAVCFYLSLRKSKSWITPTHVILLYTEVLKSHYQVKSLATDTFFIQNFHMGVRDMLLLPLPLIRTLCLLSIITEILKKGKFKSCEEIAFIMHHFFHAQSSTQKLLEDPGGLSEHFGKVMTLPIAKDLAKMPIISNKSTQSNEGIKSILGDGNKMSVMKLLVDTASVSFSQGSSSDLFKFVIKRFKKQPLLLNSLTFILKIANMLIDKNLTTKQFKSEFKEVERMVLSLPRSSETTLLIIGCITESLLLNDKQGFKALVPILLQWHWPKDMTQIYEVNFLNVPKQIVLASYDAQEIETKKQAIQRLFDVLHQVDKRFFHDVLPHIDDVNSCKEILQSLASHDFQMLTRNTLLSPKEASRILLVYSIKDFHKLIALFKCGIESCSGHCECPTEYKKSKPLTPGKLGFLILHHIRNLGIGSATIEKEFLEIFNELLRNCTLLQQCTTFQEYIEIFIQIMKYSCSLSEIKEYFQLSAQHAIESKDVLLEGYSWKSTKKEPDESFDMIQNVFNVLQTSNITSQHRTVMVKILQDIEDEKVINHLFELIFLSIPCTEACIDSTIGWENSERIALATKLKERYEKLTHEEMQRTDILLKLLPFVATAFPNSSKELGDFLDKMVKEGFEHELSLACIPTWYEEMTNAGFSKPVIKSWCSSLVHYEKLSSSDVDALTNLIPLTTEPISTQPGQILKCLFTETAPKTWKDGSRAKPDQKSVDAFKRCLQFAKVLKEFTSIAMQFKEDSKIVQKIKDGTNEICLSFVQNPSKSRILYKTRDRILKELFDVLFSGETNKVEEPILQLHVHIHLSRSLLAVFRRLARSIYRRPAVFGYFKCIVQQTFRRLKDIKDPEHVYQIVQNAIHKHVIELEPNQDAIHTLQAAGYNKSSNDEDLWCSTTIRLSSYVPSIDSLLNHRIERMLKQLLIEWRAILNELKIENVQVNGQEITVEELINHSDSLEIVEVKLQAVKQATQNTSTNQRSHLRRRQLIQKQIKSELAITKETKQETEEKKGQSSKLTRMVIVWENQVITTDSMRTCSDKIPGCYSPNGFHSEKPVICGLAVDNRILTLYEQDKSRSLTEIENVEVKLFPVGMVVYGLYSCGHCYDTEELWAAFFKMLLLNRLVPKIFLTNISPGFDWIAKNKFVDPVPSPPSEIIFSSCNTLIPAEEDSYDYEPNMLIHRLHSDHQMQELIILTPENAKEIEFYNLKSPNRDELIRRTLKKIRKSIGRDSSLLEMHTDDKIREKLIDRLMSAVRKLEEISDDGKLPDLETVSGFINLEKLSLECTDTTKTKVQENGKEFYGEIILAAFKAEVDRIVAYDKGYDCCQNVEFLNAKLIL